MAIFRLFKENKVCIQFEVRTIVIGQENKRTSKYETQILNRGGHLLCKFINKSVSAGFAVTKYVDTMAISETQIYLTALLNSLVAFFRSHILFNHYSKISSWSCWRVCKIDDKEELLTFKELGSGAFIKNCR